jgi:hypothetical protein
MEMATYETTKRRTNRIRAPVQSCQHAGDGRLDHPSPMDNRRRRRISCPLCGHGEKRGGSNSRARAGGDSEKPRDRSPVVWWQGDTTPGPHLPCFSSPPATGTPFYLFDSVLTTWQVCLLYTSHIYHNNIPLKICLIQWLINLNRIRIC